jgi:hypothetical protein
MKKILFLTGVISLLSTTGCLVVPEREPHGHYHHYEGHGEVIVPVPPPPVIVRPPEVIVR